MSLVRLGRGTSTDSASADVECMSHTGRSGHKSFRCVRTSFAVVVRWALLVTALAGGEASPHPSEPPTPR